MFFKGLNLIYWNSKRQMEQNFGKLYFRQKIAWSFNARDLNVLNTVIDVDLPVDFFWNKETDVIFSLFEFGVLAFFHSLVSFESKPDTAKCKSTILQKFWFAVPPSVRFWLKRD